MQLVKVNVISSYLNPQGENKLGGEYSERDQHNLTVEQYEDMNVPIPSDSTHHQNNKEIEILDEDIEIIESVGYFLLSDFKMVVAGEDFGATIYLKDSYVLNVAETPRQIVNQINKLNK